MSRVINHSNAPGTVRITGIDDTGRRHGPVNLRLKPREARQFNAPATWRRATPRGG